MKLFRASVFAITLLLAPLSQAAVYEFPGDGWYQLQHPETHQEMCNSDTPVCDVPAGIYLLINHSVGSSDSRHRVRIEIGDGAKPQPVNPINTSQYRIESTQATSECIHPYPGRFSTDDDLCVARCPDSYTVTGGSCRATLDTEIFTLDENGNPNGVRDVSLRVPMIELLRSGGYACDIDRQADFHPYEKRINNSNFRRTNITATAICSTIVTQ